MFPLATVIWCYLKSLETSKPPWKPEEGLLVKKLMDTYGTWAVCWAAIPPVEPKGNWEKSSFCRSIKQDFTIKYVQRVFYDQQIVAWWFQLFLCARQLVWWSQCCLRCSNHSPENHSMHWPFMCLSQPFSRMVWDMEWRSDIRWSASDDVFHE